MNYFNLFVGLSVLLITCLAMNISRIRMKERIGNGDGDSITLKKAIRAHMNAIEHILPFAFVLYVISQSYFNSLLLPILALGFILARLLHAHGMLAPNFSTRRVGAGLSYLFELVGCCIILFNL
jgi:uncharacterized membrane protein YecN with MAPEG domain